MVSNCCSARFYEPDYPDNDICSACGEHAEPFEQAFHVSLDEQQQRAFQHIPQQCLLKQLNKKEKE